MLREICPLVTMHTAQQYWNRKHDYAINVQIVGGPDGLIYDVVARCYGSANDACVYEWSEVRGMLENYGRFHVTGDLAYPMLPVMVKPYPIAEAANDRSKARFNYKHSGMRTIMTEHIFGRLKKRFPILRQLRYHLELSQKVILACCILHNMAVKFKTPFLADDDLHDNDGHEDDDDFPLDYADDLLVPEEIRIRAKRIRDELKNSMR